MSRYIFILVLSAILTYGVISLTANRTIDSSTSNAIDFYSYSMAVEVAKSGMQMAMSQLGDDPDWRLNTPQKVKCFDGTASFYVKDTIFAGNDLIKFYVDGSFNGVHHFITAYVDKFPLIPPAFKGAITTNNDVLTLGSLNVDGRNHTMSATLVPESGTYAIWTTHTVDQSGNSYLGGTSEGVDIPLLKPADPRVIAELQNYPGGYPTSPDSILGGPAYGYPEGMLKSIAMTGINGSQYVTDPTLLSHPLSGITYVELTDEFPHNKWEDAEVEGSGLLVVHNTSTNALIWNMEYGTFVGLVIIDDIVHVHTTIVGALIVLTPNPSSGNTIGNSDGLVLYSTEAIRFALSQTDVPPKYNFGFGNNRLYIKYWYE
jgi:hypothetical protein